MDIKLKKVDNKKDTFRQVLEKYEYNFDTLREAFINLGLKRYREKFIATEGQVDFQLAHSYRVRTNSIQVWVNNAQQFSPENFTEVSPTSIRLNFPCKGDDEINVIYSEFDDFRNMVTHASTHHRGGTDEIDIKDLKDSEGYLSKKKTVQYYNRFQDVKDNVGTLVENTVLYLLGVEKVNDEWCGMYYVSKSDNLDIKYSKTLRPGAGLILYKIL